MKTKNFFAIMTFVFPFMLASCGKNEVENANSDFKNHDYRVDNVLYPKGSKLKRIYNGSGESKTLSVEYSYDNLGKIYRSDSGSETGKSYAIYQYNTVGQLEKIVNYWQYLDNPTNISQTISYSYDVEGNKVKELYEWEDLNSVMQSRYILYQYNGNKLMKQENYEKDQLYYYSEYEYKGNKIAREKICTPGSKDYATRDYYYDQEILIYSISYVDNPKSGFGSDERRYYDQNDNLIKIVGNYPGLSSWSGATSFYVTTEYEYE